MLNFNLTFRRIVLKNIPQLNSEQLDQHESLIALRHQVIQENTIVPPSISVKPSSYDFGSVAIRLPEDKAKSQTFVVKNNGAGTATLKVTKIHLIGNNKDFRLKTEVTSFDLKPSKFKEIQVIFNPTSEGNKEATLTIESNDPDEPALQVPLTGVGVSPDIEVEPGSHDFCDVSVNEPESQTFIVTNKGKAQLSAEAKIIGYEEYDPDQFIIKSGGGEFRLNPGENQEIVVEFAPNCVGEKKAKLRISSNDPDENPFDVPLMGTGLDVYLQARQTVTAKTQLEPMTFLERLATQATEEANDILGPYSRQYRATVQLYNARRRLALKGGNFLQIPTTVAGVAGLVKAILNYRWVQIETFPTLAANRLRYFFENITRGQVIAIVVGVFFVSMGLLALEPKGPTEQPAPTEIQPAHPDSVITEKR